MGFPTKVQLIKRKKSEQWYINFPSAIAQAMEFSRGEVVEWIIEDKANLILHRTTVPASPIKKKPKTQSSRTSTNCGKSAGAHSTKNEPGKGPKHFR
jgi:hypothetical protein